MDDDNPQYVVCPVVMNQQGLWRLLNCPLRMSLASILHTERPEIMKHWDNVTTIQGMLSAALPKCEKPKGQQQESNRIYFSRKKSSHNLTMIHHVIVVLWCSPSCFFELVSFSPPNSQHPKVIRYKCCDFHSATGNWLACHHGISMYIQLSDKAIFFQQRKFWSAPPIAWCKICEKMIWTCSWWCYEPSKAHLTFQIQCLYKEPWFTTLMTGIHMHFGCIFGNMWPPMLLWQFASCEKTWTLRWFHVMADVLGHHCFCCLLPLAFPLETQ